MYFLMGILVALGYGSYLVLMPFVRSLAWAGVLAVVFYPLYSLLCRRIRWTSVASIITILIIIVLIIGPISWVGLLIAGEISTIAEHGGGLGGGDLPDINSILADPQLSWFMDKANTLFDIKPDQLAGMIRSGLAGVGTSILSNLQAGTENIVLAAVDFMLMLVATFFLLQDGAAFIEWVRGHMPFEDAQSQRLARMVKDIVVSTMYGGLAVALVQGLIGGVAFYFLKVPSAGLLGFAVGLTSFIPMVGTALVWVPVAGYLLFAGSTMKALILVLVGVFIIGTVDNILRPLIMGSRVKLHTLLIFFGILGGMKAFGFLGLIAGPMCIALFVSVFEIFKDDSSGSESG